MLTCSRFRLQHEKQQRSAIFRNQNSTFFPLYLETFFKGQACSNVHFKVARLSTRDHPRETIHARLSTRDYPRETIQYSNEQLQNTNKISE